MHLPDQLDEHAMAEMRKVSEITETLELLQRADVVLYGIGRADDMGKKRQLPPDILADVLRKGAVAEAYGCYFDESGSGVFSPRRWRTIWVSSSQTARCWLWRRARARRRPSARS